MDEQLKLIDQISSRALDFGVQFGPKLLVAALILAAGWFAGVWAGRATLRGLERLRLEPPVRKLIERVVRLFVLGLFAIIALQNLGVELLPLIAGLSIAGAGVALAMQGVLANVAAGLTIIFTRPYRVGDYLSIQKEDGVVLDITLFSTVLGHTDLSRVVIPNRKIVGEILHNYGQLRQLEVEMSVAYGADLAAALAAVDEVLRANPRVLQDPAPVVAVARVTPAQASIAVKPWVKVPDYGPATSEVNRALLEAFRSRGIAMPVALREIRMLPAQ